MSNRVKIGIVYRTITGEDISPDRLSRMTEIAHALDIRPDDPLFASMVASEAYHGLYTDMPLKIAAAAVAATREAAEASRARIDEMVSAGITDAVDMNSFNRRFQRAAISSVVASAMTIALAAGVGTWFVKSAAEAAAREAASAVASEVAEKIPDAYLAEFKARTDGAVREFNAHRVAVTQLIEQEVKQPGTIEELLLPETARARRLIMANNRSACPLETFDTSPQRRPLCVFFKPQQ